MANIDSALTLEDEMKMILDQDVRVYLNPPDNANSLIMSLEYDTGIDSSNQISTGALKGFRWGKARKFDRHCPKLGENIDLAIIHTTRYDDQIELTFTVRKDSRAWISIGRAACETIVSTWTDDKRIFLFMKAPFRGQVVCASCGNRDTSR